MSKWYLGGNVSTSSLCGFPTQSFRSSARRQGSRRHFVYLFTDSKQLIFWEGLSVNILKSRIRSVDSVVAHREQAKKVHAKTTCNPMVLKGFHKHPYNGGACEAEKVSMIHLACGNSDQSVNLWYFNSQLPRKTIFEGKGSGTLHSMPSWVNWASWTPRPRFDE